jgi:hypothetical protein
MGAPPMPQQFPMFRVQLDTASQIKARLSRRPKDLHDGAARRNLQHLHRRRTTDQGQ